MTALVTTSDVAVYLWVTAAVIALTCLAIKAREWDRAAEENRRRRDLAAFHAQIAAQEDPWRDWANDAVALANDHSFDRTLAEIRALPTKETA